MFDRYEVTNPAPDVTVTGWHAVTGWDTWVTSMCPGCQAWQVDEPPQPDDDAAAVFTDALHEHRAECPALDMFAGLAGIPPG